MGAAYPQDVLQRTLDGAVRKCPFLHRLASNQGTDFAEHIATRPSVPASSAERLPRASLADFSATFQTFHGDEGVLPLHRPGVCPYAARQTASQTPAASRASDCRQASTVALPFASLSMAGAFNFLVSLIEQVCCLVL